LADNPSKVSRLQRLWLAALIFTHGLWTADVFQAFDCSDPPIGVRQYSVLDAGNCPLSAEPPEPVTREEGMLAQKLGTDMLPIVRCNLLITMACIPRGDKPDRYYQKLGELSPEACRQANATGRVNYVEGKTALPLRSLVPFHSEGEPVNQTGRYIVNWQTGSERRSSGWSEKTYTLPSICYAQRKHLTPLLNNVGNGTAAMVITVATEYVSLDPVLWIRIRIQIRIRNF
jgi:hypothetical protein